jgi:alcohol dehydrogenase
VPPRSQFGFGATGGPWGGALSDLVRVPFADAMLVLVPDGLPPADIASVSDNVPDGYRAAGVYLEDEPGQSVLIIGGGGGGSIGLYAAGIACAMGAPLVHYMDPDPRRNAVAESLGATVIDWPPPERLGPYPITVNATGDAAALACAVRSTEPGGTCTSTGIYFSPTTMPLLDMFVTGMTFKTGRAHARAFIPRVLNLIHEGRFHPEVVTSAVIPWENAAVELLDIQLKVVIARAD